jgi:hypothetical protein
MVKGSPVGTIVVKQTGGKLGSTIQEVRDDQLMKVGARYVLYLQRVPTGPYSGDYFVVGGGQGRLDVDSLGHLSSATVKLPANATAATLTAGQ